MNGQYSDYRIGYNGALHTSQFAVITDGFDPDATIVYGIRDGSITRENADETADSMWDSMVELDRSDGNESADADDDYITRDTVLAYILDAITYEEAR